MFFVLCSVGSNFQRKPSQHRRDKFLLPGVFFFSAFFRLRTIEVSYRQTFTRTTFTMDLKFPKHHHLDSFYDFFPYLNNVFVGNIKATTHYRQ